MLEVISNRLRPQDISLINKVKKHFDYLGFIFDGKSVSMKSKSPYKFYRKAYKPIRRAKMVQRQKSLTKTPYQKEIYGLYTNLGLKRGKYGNFISYAKRAQRIFDNMSPSIENLMMNQIVNRKRKNRK